MRKTKLVITLGPALADTEKLREALALADVVRINASHGDLEGRKQALDDVRRISEDLNRKIPVLLDLQGPKWRVGTLDPPAELPEGSLGAFHPPEDPAPKGFAWTAPLPHPELFNGARVGQTWTLDDGALEVKISGTQPRLLLAKVLTGGLLKSKKGVHPVGLDVVLDPLTPKDLEDIQWGVAHGVDMFAISFVRRASDVRALDARLKELGGPQYIIAKIEHPMALDNLDEILDAAWGVMVARGDLGVELGVEHVPSLQKRIIRRARMALKPVITATQMLESMIENPQPTRAESSDVANAIWDGSDAVMLSGESAAGKHPLEAIRWLAKIAEDADTNDHARVGRFSERVAPHLAHRTDVSVAFAACRTAEDINATWIVVFTEGGMSARMVSRLAAGTPVIGATSNAHIARCLNLMRGVQTEIIPWIESTDGMVDAVEALLRARYDAKSGDRAVMTMGLPVARKGATNTMRVVEF